MQKTWKRDGGIVNVKSKVDSSLARGRHTKHGMKEKEKDWRVLSWQRSS